MPAQQLLEKIVTYVRLIRNNETILRRQIETALATIPPTVS
jgi:hypothetical protein